MSECTKALIALGAAIFGVILCYGIFPLLFEKKPGGKK